MSKTILITGAGGLLGRYAANLFAGENEVHALLHRLPEKSSPAITYHLKDFSREWSTESLPKSVDTIIHLAQSSHFREFPEQAMDVFNVNVASTAQLLDYARRVGCKNFIYASSGGVYEAGTAAVNENSPIIPHKQLGYYLGSKLCGEVLVQNYANLINVSILRFFFMYGAGQRRSMLIPRLVDNVLTGQAISLQGDEGLMINPLHVSDAAEALRCVMESKGSNTFNVAGSEALSLKSIAILIGKLVGKEPSFTHIPGENSRLIADIEALKGYGWLPRMPFRQGLEDLLP